MQLLLRDVEDADGGVGLAQLIVDRDEGLDRGVGAFLELELLVVQRLCIRVALLSQGAQRPAAGGHERAA